MSTSCSASVIGGTSSARPLPPISGSLEAPGIMAAPARANSPIMPGGLFSTRSVASATSGPDQALAAHADHVAVDAPGARAGKPGDGLGHVNRQAALGQAVHPPSRLPC